VKLRALGLKPGMYHLVVHESGDCGKNATRAGAVFAAASDVALKLDVAKGAPASLEELDVALMLDGDDSIVGHTLVLHEDKKGKPGKAIACGTIVAEGSDDE
jgi:Cu/Zn superoxide dismutase